MHILYRDEHRRPQKIYLKLISIEADFKLDSHVTLLYKLTVKTRHKNRFMNCLFKPFDTI